MALPAAIPDLVSFVMSNQSYTSRDAGYYSPLSNDYDGLAETVDDNDSAIGDTESLR